MDVRLPDGTVIKGVPDGTTRADIVAKLKGNGMAVPAEWLAPTPAAVSTGSAIRDIPRQVGLTARYGLEGLGQAVDPFTEPLRRMVVNPIARSVGLPEARPVSEEASRLATLVGLPQPQGANERVIGDAARMVAGAGGLAGAAGAAGRATAGTTQNVLQTLAANPGTQVAGAAGAGLSGGSVREAGGSPVEQVIASLAGGIAGGASTQMGQKMAEAAKRAMTPKTVQMQRADQQIQLVLERSGVDWSQVPERIKSGLRQEVADAMDTGGELNPDAIRRLLVFRRAGVTPTVGQLTQDPGQITREANLAKTGANSTDANLQRLPALQNANTASLLRQLDAAGAETAPNAAGAGQAAIESLTGTVNANRQNINSLYSAARDTNGRSALLDGHAWTMNANRALDDANVGSFLPPDIAKKMNAIAAGEYPLTVDVAEQLKTSIGNIQRGSADGNVRRALGIVRAALDEAPLQGAPTVNPGNLPAVAGTVPPSPQVLGTESLRAFNDARSANRSWMQRVEANPALQAVVDGVEPDQFVQRFIVGKGASAADVGRLRNELTPEAAQGIKTYLVRHLKDAATNSTEDVTKFSNAAYRKALRDIGEDKLRAFFTREELQHLTDLGDAAKYMQAQPAGAAVNNSNSGALLLGRGLDVLDRIANNVPIGRDVIKGWVQGAQQTQVLDSRNALQLVTNQKAPPPRLNPLLAAIAASPVQARQDDRRK